MITGTTILLIVMWVVCTTISMTGMICKRNIDVVSIMSIPLIVTIFVMFFAWWKIYFKERNNTWLNIFVTYVVKKQGI